MTTLQTVLIVEDEPDIQMLAELALHDIGGLEIKVAADGVQALEILKTWQPDLVLMDVMMPNMTGPETLENMRLKKETADIPILFMTADSEQERESVYLDLGAIAVLSKPFEPMTLAERLVSLYDQISETSS